MNTPAAWLLGALVILAGPGSAVLARAALPTDVVHTDSGALSGARAGDIVSYKGIPYAAPPVGPLRWRAPQSPAPWRGARAATAFGRACIQPEVKFPGFSLGAPTSEDCLYLNVWRPLHAAGPLPVMVWIHGGALVTGAASQPEYDGSALAGRVVLVSFNYRLGRLGYFAHPALTREAADGGRIGNYGLMDQVAALRWVARNIRAFGGDPNRVTIFGQSAGAASVLALMISPPARGLFQRAIAESGYGRGSYPRISSPAPDGQPAAEQDGEALMKGVGVDASTAASLRAVPLARIQELPPYDFTVGANFLLDGKLLREDLWQAWRAGHEAPVPLIIGATALESGVPLTPEMRERMAGRFARYLHSQERPALIAAYGDEVTLDEQLGSDIGFAAHAFSLGALHLAHSHPTWRYRFAALPEAARSTFRGTPHAAELPYVFGTLATGRWPAGPRDDAVSAAVMSYWVDFAGVGVPAPAGLAAWPGAGADRIMLFTDAGPSPAEDDRSARYRALAAIIDPRS